MKDLRSIEFEFEINGHRFAARSIEATETQAITVVKCDDEGLKVLRQNEPKAREEVRKSIWGAWEKTFPQEKNRIIATEDNQHYYPDANPGVQSLSREEVGRLIQDLEAPINLSTESFSQRPKI